MVKARAPGDQIQARNGASRRRDPSMNEALAHVYFEDQPGRQSTAKLVARDERRRIAINTAKLPELLKKAVN
jgi:hypothetical protein